MKFPRSHEIETVVRLGHTEVMQSSIAQFPFPDCIPFRSRATTAASWKILNTTPSRIRIAIYFSTAIYLFAAEHNEELLLDHSSNPRLGTSIATVLLKHSQDQTSRASKGAPNREEVYGYE
jgi:hypothetical protein